MRRFAADPGDPLLRVHKLEGELRDYWSFTVDGDLRVLFRWDGDAAFLVNLGSHGEAARPRPSPSLTARAGLLRL